MTREYDPRYLSDTIEDVQVDDSLQSGGRELAIYGTWVLSVDEGLLTSLQQSDQAQVSHILTHNLRVGRAQRVMARTSGARSGEDDSDCHKLDEFWRAYQIRVVQVYLQECERLHALATNDAETWSTLSRQLARSAYRMLVQKGVSSGFALDKSAEIAQQTCERVFVSVFPCDVAFDLWTHTILKNVVLQHLTRSQDLLDRQKFVNSLDDMNDRGISYVATPINNYGGASVSTRDIAIGAEEAQSLIEAIELMRSEERRAVIVYTYFSGLSDDEIASKLGRTKGVIQTLRHRALRQLRAFFGD